MEVNNPPGGLNLEHRLGRNLREDGLNLEHRLGRNLREDGLLWALIAKLGGHGRWQIVIEAGDGAADEMAGDFLDAAVGDGFGEAVDGPARHEAHV